MSPIPLTGFITTALTGTVTVNYDDPTNPLLHRYHPQHDNMRELHDALKGEYG